MNSKNSKSTQKNVIPGYRFLHASLRSRAARTALRSPITALAEQLGKTVSYVEKLMRPAPSDAAPNGSGLPNPIDACDALFDFWLRYCPAFAELFIRRYRRKLSAHKDRQRRLSAPTRRELEEQVGIFFREQSSLYGAIARQQASADEWFQAWLQSEGQFEQLLAMKEAHEDRAAGLRAVS